MATTVAQLLASVRTLLREPTARYWTDAELVGYINDAFHELWKGVIDLYQDHHITIDETNMSIVADSATISGVPTDLFRIRMIQPRTVGSGATSQGLIFKPRTLADPDFVQAQAVRAIAPRNRIIYYAVTNPGSPVAAPSIRIAPRVSSTVLLAVWYIPTIPIKVVGDANPIPGESDVAVRAYALAYAYAKQRPDQQPDPEWLSVYATEKRNMLIALTPRSDQEPQTAVGMFEPAGLTDSFFED